MIPIQQQQQVLIVNPQQMAYANAYYVQLQQQQRQQQMAALNSVKFDVPQDWRKETTFLKFSQKVCCFGKTAIFTTTENFGRIDFFRGKAKCCGVKCHNPCGNMYGHKEIKFYFNNVPNEKCPIEIELCCLKTALIRYKGVVIGKVEALVTGCCASAPRFIVKPIDESKQPMVLVPINTCMNKCDAMSGYPCHEPKKIEVQKAGKPFTFIMNTHERNTGCITPCKEQNAFFAKGEINFDPSMPNDEKVLLVCGWIIMQGFISGVL